MIESAQRADTDRPSSTELVVDEQFTLNPDPAASRRPPDRPAWEWRWRKAFEVHSALREMLAASHAIDVCLGALLRLMSACRGFQALGHRSLGDYLTQELRQSSARRLQYLAAIDKAIVERPLPLLGAAWRRGEVTVSVARVLVQVATPDNEAQWLQTARSMTAEELRAEAKRALRESRGFRPGVSMAPEDDPEAWRRSGFAATAPVDAAWHVFLETARRMAGFDAPVHWCVDDLTAEYASGCTLLPDTVPARGSEPGGSERDAGEREADTRELRRRTRQVTRLAAEDLEVLRRAGRSARLRADPLGGLRSGEPPDPQDLHMRIRWVLRVSQRIAWHQMRLARAMADSRLYQRLGFASFSGYAEQALDISPRSAWSLVSLARALERHPRVEGAFLAGEVTAVEAGEVCRVARPGTQGDWLARARTSTLQQLREDVAFVLATDDPTGLPPYRPLPAGMEPIAHVPAPRIWRGVESGGDVVIRAGDRRRGRRPRVQICSGGTSSATATSTAHRTDHWYAMFAGDPQGAAAHLLTAGGRMRPIVFTAPESIAVQWELTLRDCRARMEALEGWGASGSGWDKRETTGRAAASCVTDSQVVAILVLNFLGQWAHPEILRASRALKVFTRDGWRCQAPGCRSRAHLNAHHVIFRSRNGPDHAWNLVTVCRAHHEVLHAGRIAVRGRAPHHLIWALGVNASGGVRERFAGGTRVEFNPDWRAGAGRLRVRAPDDWREG